jgi:hypothetical protein
MLKKFKRRNRGSDHEAQPQDGASTRSKAEPDKTPYSGELLSILMTQDITYHKLTGENRQPGGTPGNTTQPTPPEGSPRMIGDFDDRANALWSLQMKEAQSHDEARIKSLKDGMDGVLIFVRVHISVVILYSSPTHDHLGRSLLRHSRFLHHRKGPGSSSRSYTADGLLSATECCPTRPDL